MKCKKCGSYAINPGMRDRGNDNTDLRDVCYWKEKFKELKELINEIFQSYSPYDLAWNYLAKINQTGGIR